MLHRIALVFIASAERRLGVSLDYVREIAAADFRLLLRYNRIFGFLDPNRQVPPLAYHLARLRGALAADCGTCVAAEINLARTAGLSESEIDLCLGAGGLSDDLEAVRALADAVVRGREDTPEARDRVRAAFGDKGLIELSFAMNGAALLPGVKRALGHATACDLEVVRRMAGTDVAG